MRILSYCLVPNHWHFVPWPEYDGDLGRLMQRLTVTYVTPWQKHYNMVGYGRVYQNRFKSFPVESDAYFDRVNRSVERNALRAKLVSPAQAWKWGSLWIRQYRFAEHRATLSKWPPPEMASRCQRARRSKPKSKRFVKAVIGGTPYGRPDWVIETAQKLGLESTWRLPGTPKKR